MFLISLDFLVIFGLAISELSVLGSLAGSWSVEGTAVLCSLVFAAYRSAMRTVDVGPCFLETSWRSDQALAQVFLTP